MTTFNCEEAVGASYILAQHIVDPRNTSLERVEDHRLHARFVNPLTDRIVPEQDPNNGFDMKIEKVFEWAVDKTSFEGIGIPSVKTIRQLDGLSPFHLSKLYTANTGYVLAVYHGCNRKKSTVRVALDYKEIMSEVRGVLSETSRLVVSGQGIDEKQQAAYVVKILERLSNPHLELESSVSVVTLCASSP